MGRPLRPWLLCLWSLSACQAGEILVVTQRGPRPAREVSAPEPPGVDAGLGGASGGTGGAPGSSGGSTAGTGGAAGSGGVAGTGGAPGSGGAPGTGGAAGGGGAASSVDPVAGNPDGHCAIPAEAGLEDSSHPTTVVGNGTADSCTGDAFVSAVAQEGVITFNCGAAPRTIALTRTAKVFNDKGPKVVIDGGGKITLSGVGKVRILYQNSCDEAQHWTTSHCDDQDSPALTVQNLTFADGNSKGETTDGGGGGAIFVRGGRFKIVNSRFFNNVCDDTGADVGGAAVRTLSQYHGLPVYVVNSTFGGKEGLGNVCSNGAGLSSIGVSYDVINSVFSYNRAVGNGANPARDGTPGGGSGGGIYNDGDTYALSLCGVKMSANSANEGGGAIFFVSNDRTGTLSIKDSQLQGNASMGFETDGLPGIFVLAAGPPLLSGTTLK
jgi:hypothetical protein